METEIIEKLKSQAKENAITNNAAISNNQEVFTTVYSDSSRLNLVVSPTSEISQIVKVEVTDDIEMAGKEIEQNDNETNDIEVSQLENPAVDVKIENEQIDMDIMERENETTIENRENVQQANNNDDKDNAKTNIEFKALNTRSKPRKMNLKIYTACAKKRNQITRKMIIYKEPGSINKDHMDDIIAQWLPMLQCIACPQQFPNFYLLKKHFDTEHKGYKFSVKCCQQRYTYKTHLAKHIMEHQVMKGFKCNECGKIFQRRLNLVLHQKQTHPSTQNRERKSFPELDGIIAKWKSSLDCVVCMKKFETFANLKKHFESEHQNKKLYVLCCDRRFYRRFPLVEHCRVHLDPDTFKCGNCGKQFWTKLQMRSHVENCLKH